MQTPTGRQRPPTHPIPRPRPHGPADLGVLADDLDYLADMNGRSPASELRTGMRSAPEGGKSAPDSYADPYADPYAVTDPETGAEPAWDDADADPGLETAPAGPIFVDASGRRRKLARRASLAAIAVVAGYAGLLAVSFAGGPIPPKALLPVPGMPAEKDPAPASTSVAQNGAETSGKPGATDHSAGRPSGSTSERKPEAHPSSTAAKPGPGTSSAPQPTATGTAAPPPTPTSAPTSGPVSSTSTSHGNPTPGHGRKSSPGPTG
ncbi:hypothetical protein [Catenulispora subtropica]|uniref:Uncharacterized protein n=1 Tax=Catenulispora subtropica TaxID=450798 RepID=A0ABN2SLY1_9ACTN